MDNQYCAILSGALDYEQTTQKFICVSLIVLIVIILVLGISQFRKATLSNKIVIILIVLVLCAVFGGYIYFSNKNQEAIKSDILNGDFVEYNGEYTHDNYQKDSFYHNVYIREGEEKVILRYPDYGNHYQLHSVSMLMPTGTFKGSIVYARSSRIVVAWSSEN